MFLKPTVAPLVPVKPSEAGAAPAPEASSADLDDLLGDLDRPR